jgi:hypothetical protein
LFICLSVGQHRQLDSCDWLVRHTADYNDLKNDRANLIELASDAPAERYRTLRAAGRLFYRTRDDHFQLWGFVREQGIDLPISELFLVGAGMHRLKLEAPDD